MSNEKKPVAGSLCGADYVAPAAKPAKPPHVDVDRPLVEGCSDVFAAAADKQEDSETPSTPHSGGWRYNG